MTDWTLKEATDFIDRYGDDAYAAALEADRFGLNRVEVAEAINAGANEAQALLGQAVLQDNKDTFDFAWESSAELVGMVDALDGIKGNLGNTWSAREHLVDAALNPEAEDVTLVGAPSIFGGLGVEVAFDFG